jgi:predicted nucleic acid-binding protein
MDIVVDTSVLMAVILSEPEREAIIRATSGHTLVGPESIRWEIGNAFSAMFKKDRISLREAQQGMVVFDAIPIRYLDVDLRHSLMLSHDNHLHAYDAYFLDCAIRHKAPLLSLDGQMTAKARVVGVDILEIQT